MERFWRTLGAALGRRWRLVLLVTLLLTGGLAYGFSRVEFATGQDSYLNSDSQVAVDNVEYQNAFGGESIILLFELDEGKDISDLFTPANRAEFVRIEEQIRAVPEVTSTITPFTSLIWSESIATSGAGTNALISAADRDTDPASTALRKADIDLSLARLGAVGDQSLDNPAWTQFLLFANDGFAKEESGDISAPATLTIRPSLLPTFPALDTAVGGVVLKGNATLDELSAGTQSVIDIMKTAKFEGATLTVTGAPFFLKDINDYLQGGMVVLGLTAFVVMAVILLLLFPVRLRLLPLVSVLFGVIWAFSILGWVGIDLSLVTISGLPILIGVGIDFAIQIHNRYEEEHTLGTADPLGETVANLAPALIAATLAGVGAFVALRVSKVPMIRDFGVLLAVGIVVLVLLGILLPATVLGARDWKLRSKRSSRWVERFVLWLGSMPTKLVAPLAVASVLLFALGLITEGNTKIQSDPVRWVDQSSQTVKDIGHLEDRTGFSSTLGVLIQANNVLDPAVIDVIQGFVLDAEARPDVVSTSSLEGTMAKVILVPGAAVLSPTPADLQAAEAVMPEDIREALLIPDLTSTQVNLRLAPASLDQRAVIVKELQADLQQRIDKVQLPADSVLTSAGVTGGPVMRAVPSGLAVVGVGLLENLSANRALLTYLALSIAACYLVIRHRSLARGLLALVPAILAIGVSSLVVGGLGLTLSPLTTVSGPLVVATCTEFAVLILARYLEERERGLPPREASDTASTRTGRAFFTSAATIIGGFATLVISPLPLLRDFGLIVTLNVAIAVIAALVAMPALSVWADQHGLIGVVPNDGAVRLAAPARGSHFEVAALAAVALAVTSVVLYQTADTDQAVASSIAYDSTPLPTTTTIAPTTTAAGTVIDPASYGTTRPDGVVAGTLFDLLTSQGVPANQAVCTAEVLLTRTTETDLIAAGIASFGETAVEPVIAAALDCQISQDVIDATLTAARGG